MIRRIGKQNDWVQCVNKINELVVAVNTLIDENNIHERQIDCLQIKVKDLQDHKEDDQPKTIYNVVTGEMEVPKVKCPFCGEELVPCFEHDDMKFLYCPNWCCDGPAELIGSETMWRWLGNYIKRLKGE